MMHRVSPMRCWIRWTRLGRLGFDCPFTRLLCVFSMCSCSFVTVWRLVQCLKGITGFELQKHIAGNVFASWEYSKFWAPAKPQAIQHTAQPVGWARVGAPGAPLEPKLGWPYGYPLKGHRRTPRSAKAQRSCLDSFLNCSSFSLTNRMFFDILLFTGYMSGLPGQTHWIVQVGSWDDLGFLHLNPWKVDAFSAHQVPTYKSDIQLLPELRWVCYGWNWGTCPQPSL
jgi:hypothetical protein